SPKPSCARKLLWVPVLFLQFVHRNFRRLRSPIRIGAQGANMNIQTLPKQIQLLRGVRKKAGRISAISILTCVLLASGATVMAQTNTTFDPTGSNNTFPTAINNTGTIAGYYIDNVVGGFHGFLRDTSGNITTFNPPADTASGTVVLWGMNNLGAV